MAQHKKKHPPQQQHLSSQKRIDKKNNNVVFVAIIIFGLLGLGIAFFAAGANVMWLTAGTLLGAVSGYFFGRQVVKGLSKK